MRTRDISVILVFALAMGLAGGVANGQYTLSGRVYEGNVGDTTTPLTGVTVELYGAIDSNEQGTLLDSATTDPTGWYGLDVPIDPIYGFYNIVQDELSGYEFVGATTVGGSVRSSSWIQYTYPLEGKTLTGNRFWQRPPNSPPVITSTAVTTATEDTLYTYDVEATDPDSDPLAYSLTTSPAGMTIDAATGLIQWTPSGTQVGSHDVTVQVSDGRGGSDTQNFTINVSEVPNSPPVANDDIAVTQQDTPVMIDVLANDSDEDGDVLAVVSVTDPCNGEVAVGSPDLVGYTPNLGFYGTDEFTYTVGDGRGGTDTATVSVTVEQAVPENNPPVANDDAAITQQDTPVMIDVLANDSDLDDDPLTVVGFTHGENGSVAVEPDPIQYTPDPDFYGTDTFTYTISDGRGGVDTATVSVTVEEEPTNQPPEVFAGDDEIIVTDTLPIEQKLTCVVLDDGLPDPPGQLSLSWSMVEGPAPVHFYDPTMLHPAVTFYEYGTYVLRLVAEDGGSGPPPSDDVTIVIRESEGGNEPPRVHAVDLTVECNPTLLPFPVPLAGTVEDDGLPEGEELVIEWTLISGPGEVEFEEPANPQTTASFPAYGSYLLRLRAFDGEFEAFDEVIVEIRESEGENQPPEVFAGDDQVFVADGLPIELKWGAEASDDGLPDPPGQLSLSWSMVEGPAPVQFYDPTMLHPAVTFYEYGTYVLRLVAEDGGTGPPPSDDVTIEIRESEGGNQPPRVHAVDLTIECDPTLLPFPVPLAGTVEDDGLPEGEELVIEWTLVSGPGEVEFEEPANPQTTASFSAYGSYVLRLRAFDGEFEAFDNVVIEIGESAAQDEYDFGDAPVPYPTLYADNGAQHQIVQRVYLGATVDGETDGQPSASALGDDGTPPPPSVDDEDGVILGSLVVGRSAVVTVTASADGYLDAWVDFDCNGDWADPSEHVLITAPVTTGVNSLAFPVPATATHGKQTYARFRFRTENTPLSYDGLADDGEVEDYMVDNINPPEYDFGDAPTSAQSDFTKSYPTTLAQDGARHMIVDRGPYLGWIDVPDADTDGQPDPKAEGDDADGNDDEEAGAVLLGSIPLKHVQSKPYEVRVSVGGTGYVGAWIDFSCDGDWDDDGEDVFHGLLTDGVHELAVAVPPGCELRDTFGRFRITSVSGRLEPTGPAMDGEVEDHSISIPRADFGDAPAPYPTLYADNGAYHSESGGWEDTVEGYGWLGKEVDTEPDGQPHPNALGDDTGPPNPGGPAFFDDEDGVTFLTKLIPGRQATVQVETQIRTDASGMYADAILCAWIDFDGDGTWSDRTERIIDPWPIYKMQGSYTDKFDFQVPADAKVGTTFARFRIGTLAPSDPLYDLQPTGYGGVGEVEDYEVTIVEEGPPQVFAGEDLVVTRPVPLPFSVDLVGTVSDDGLPDPPGKVTTTWSVAKVGPPPFPDSGVPLHIEDPTSLETTATVYSYGLYVIELVAEDGGSGGPQRDYMEIQIIDPRGGPVAYYPFYEGEGTTAHDVSGNGHHGTLLGEPHWVNGLAGLGGALGFDGENYVSIPHHEAFNIFFETTVAGWALKKVDTCPIVIKGNAWGLEVVPPSGEGGLMRFGFRVGGDEYAVGGYQWPAGEWHHVVGVYDGNEVRLYVNGELDASKAYSGPIATNDASVTIGGNPLDSDDVFIGMIDEVRIYDRALTAGEATMLWASALAGDVTYDGVVDYEDVGILAKEWLIEADYLFFDAWDRPGTYLNQDIGSPAKAGGASYDEVDDVWTIAGDGTDIWDNFDDFHYVYEPVSGDAQITARVPSLDSVSIWGKAGLMIRETLEPDSKHATMLVSGGHGAAFQWRDTAGGPSERLHGGEAADVKAPASLRIERTGDTFTGYYFDIDNGVWKQQGSATIPMEDDIYVGLAVTSHEDGELATATFDQVVLPPMAEQDIGSPAKAGDSLFDDGNDVWTVVGSGTDIGDAEDQFHYVYQPLSGDGQITARVADMKAADIWGRSSIFYEGGHALKASSRDTDRDLQSIKPDSEDIWDDQGQFDYVYESVSGDTTITARTGPVEHGPWMGASGLMLRETLEADSRHAAIFVSDSGGTGFRWRGETGGDVTISGGSTPDLNAPVCLRIERNGDTFTGYYFAGGKWVEHGSVEVPMKKDVYVGLAVTSGDRDSWLVATFDRACVFSVADLYPDGRIDLKDYGIIADMWLEELP